MTYLINVWQFGNWNLFHSGNHVESIFYQRNANAWAKTPVMSTQDHMIKILIDGNWSGPVQLNLDSP